MNVQSTNITHPAPRTIAALDAGLVIKPRLNLNDRVQELYRKLTEDPNEETREKFLRLTDGVVDSQCLEGSCTADDYSVAVMIRQKAVEMDVPEVVGQNLTTLVHTLRVVMRRYGLGRKQRRFTVGGTFVPADENNGD
jgi:hypothetical protein